MAAWRHLRSVSYTRKRACRLVLIPVDDPAPPQRTMSGNRIEVGGRRSPGAAGVGSPEKSTAGKIDPGQSNLAPPFLYLV